MSNNIITNKWVYINNLAYGQLFAATTDKKDDDHIVETGAGGHTENKYWWMIYEQDGSYYLENKVQGFMFAAAGDKKDDDHIVECRPSVNTLSEAVAAGANSTKWQWHISSSDKGLLIVNKGYGQMFAAAGDKIDNDHIVEARPGTEGITEDKFVWNLEVIDA